MKNGLGGFVNMLKRWRINLKKKKKKKQLEEESKNIKKYWRLKSVLYNTIAICYYPVGLMFNNKKSNISSINRINSKLDDIVINNKKIQEKNIEKINIELEKVKENLNYLTINGKITDNEEKEINNEIIYIEHKLEYIKNGQVLNVNKVNITSIEEKQEEQVIEDKDSKLNGVGGIEISEEQKKEYLEKITEEVKEIIIKVKSLELKVSSINDYNDLYYIQNELNYLYKKLEELLEIYKKLDIKTDNIYDFDIFKLRDSNTKLEELKEYISSSLKKVEQRKKEILDFKEEKKLETEKKEIEEKVLGKLKEDIKDKENKKEQVDELFEAKQIILTDIVKQNEYLKNKNKLNNGNILGYIGSLFKKIIGFNFILMPFGIINNPLIFGLCNAVMLSNSLKTARKLVNDEAEVNYDFLLEKYESDKQIIMHTYDMYVNCLNELDEIEKDFAYLKYDKKFLLELDKIRNHVENQILDIEEKNNMMDKNYIKLKNM